MPTFSDVFALAAGVLCCAVIALLAWNLRLHRRLRATLEPAPVAAPAPLPAFAPVVQMEAPESLAAKAQATAAAAAEKELERKHRLADAEHQAQLAQSELAALSYSVSHDLRAPLRAIDGFSQALAEDYGHALDSTAQGYLQRVRVNAKHMASLIDDLLSLSRLARAPLNREVLEIEPVAKSIMARFRKLDPERAVTLHVQPGLRAFADRQLLETALRHLLDNAWKFTSRKPAALVSVRASLETGDDGEHKIVYTIRDDGAGFDMNYAGKLFGPFQRMHTPEEFPGNGIGLATVQRIIRRHGGRIWAEAAPDQGTAIFFTLGVGSEAARLCDLGIADSGAAAAAGMPEAAPMSLSSSTLL